MEILQGRAGRPALYFKLMRFHKPIGIFLLLWPTLWALWIAARGVPGLHVLFVFVTGVVLMRAAGCVINDYADRHFDSHVRRTRDRPLASGELPPAEALVLFVVLSLIAFSLVLTLNAFTIALSFGGAALAASYPFMKRFTHLPQLHLGVSFAWSVPMAYAAVSNGLDAAAWLLFTAAVLWTVAYDTMYAMVDREDDVKIGVKSTAILFGRHDRLIIALLQLAVVLSLAAAGWSRQLGTFFYLGLLVMAALFVYQQWLIRQRQPQQCFRAFLNNNYAGLAVFGGLALQYWNH